MRNKKKESISEKVKLLIYLEDNGEKKNKEAVILKQTNNGITIQLFDKETNSELGESFFLPWHRILKIKSIKEESQNEYN